MTPSHSDPLTHYRSDSPSQIADCLPPLQLASLSPSNQLREEGERIQEQDATNEKPFSPPELVPKGTEQQHGVFSPVMRYDVTGRSHDWDHNVSSLRGGDVSSSLTPGVSHDISKDDPTDHVIVHDKGVSPSSSKSSLDDDTETNLVIFEDGGAQETNSVICEGGGAQEISHTDREVARGSSKMGPFHIASAFRDEHHHQCTLGAQSPSIQQEPSFVVDDINQCATSTPQETTIEKCAESRTRNTDSRQSTDNQESVQPTDNQESVQPTDNQESVQPTDNQESVQPTDNQESVQPTDNQESVQPTNSKEKELTTESTKIVNYDSPLMRHQRNRGYESSDDDDVFLPNPVSKLRTEGGSHVVMETEGETTEDATTTGDEMEVEKKEKYVDLSIAEEQNSPALIDKTETKSSGIFRGSFVNVWCCLHMYMPQ